MARLTKVNQAYRVILRCNSLKEVECVMAATINASMLKADVLTKATTPIVLCSFPSRVARLVDGGQYVPLNINIKLAEVLVKFPKSQRSRRAHDEVMTIVSQCQKPTLLENYEVLFDPRYDIDPIKVFTEIARRQKVVVKWCGRLNGNFLEYATPEYKDYHSFRIQDYDITCVI